MVNLIRIQLSSDLYFTQKSIKEIYFLHDCVVCLCHVLLPVKLFNSFHLLSLSVQLAFYPVCKTHLQCGGNRCRSTLKLARGPQVALTSSSLGRTSSRGTGRVEMRYFSLEVLESLGFLMSI